MLIFWPEELVFNKLASHIRTEVYEKQILILIYEFRIVTGLDCFKILPLLAHINMSDTFLGGNARLGYAHSLGSLPSDLLRNSVDLEQRALLGIKGTILTLKLLIQLIKESFLSN